MHDSCVDILSTEYFFCYSVGRIANYFNPTFKCGVPCVKKKKYV